MLVFFISNRSVILSMHSIVDWFIKIEHDFKMIDHIIVQIGFGFANHHAIMLSNKYENRSIIPKIVF